MTTEHANLLSAVDRYRTLFETLPLGIIVYDPSYHVLDCNDALASLLHSTRARITGLSFLKVPDQRIVPAIAQSLAGQPGTYQGFYRSATSGDEIIAVFRCYPVRDASGAAIGGFGLAEDATERIRGEQALRDQLALVQSQGETIRRLGAPLLRIWAGVLCLPVIGELDAERATVMTENLLRAVLEEQARFAIVDLTGVARLEEDTAQHLLTLTRAAALVGVQLVLSGIQPAVAVHVIEVGLDLQGVPKLQTLHHALQHCLELLGSD